MRSVTFLNHLHQQCLIFLLQLRVAADLDRGSRESEEEFGGDATVLRFLLPLPRILTT